MEPIHIILHPEDTSQVEALKSVMKALKIKFEITKANSYDPEFVAKINQGKKDIKEGRGKSILESKQKLSEKYGGKLSSEVADQLQKYVTRSRNEWNNSNI